MEVFEVAYTFGWEPLQQYLVKFPDGRMQVLPTCWDVEKKEWYHLYPNERIAPDDPLFLDPFYAKLGSYVCGLSFHKSEEKNLMIPLKLSPPLILRSMLPVNHVTVRAENMLKWLGQTRVGKVLPILG